MPTPLGERLRDARDHLGWSLREAERQTGVSNAHIVQIEKGTIARPDPNVLWALASGYGIGFEELMALAGHLIDDPDAQPMMGAALRALGELTQEDRRAVLEFMADLKHRRSAQ